VSLQASLRAVGCLIATFATRMTLSATVQKSEFRNPNCPAGFRRAGIYRIKNNTKSNLLLDFERGAHPSRL
jgi:hypothetical protein